MDTIVIASYLEPEHVARIEAASASSRVLYEPDLLAPPRYPADHTNVDIDRGEVGEARWRELLGKASILFDFDSTHKEDLPDLAPGVRWVQATSSGIGQFVKRFRYAERMPNTVFTTAAGVHAQPLAEFATTCILMDSRRVLHTARMQRERRWERFAGSDLEGKTVLVVGMGSIGSRVGRFCKALGMTVVATKRSPEHWLEGEVTADEIHGPESLPTLLPRADYVVLIAPHTPETEGLIGAEELRLLRRGAALINISRGALIDEPALIEALREGHVGAAYLDVFREEPLPETSPLWDMDNVLVSPHSGSTSDRENERITDLFCENLERWAEGRPLLNVLDVERMY